MARRKSATFICDECGQLLANRCILATHVEIHMQRKYNCMECDFVFKTFNTLKRHQHCVHKLNFLHCDLCPFKTKQRVSFYQHFRSVHWKIKQQCIICLAWLGSSRSLYTHMVLMHGNDKFVCDECNFSTRLKTHLTTHIISKHLKLRQFQCAVCGDTFAESVVFRRHSAIHGKKNYICDNCNERFVLHSNVHKHIAAVHLKYGPFSCRFCPKTFSSNGNLRAHHKRMHRQNQGQTGIRKE